MTTESDTPTGDRAESVGTSERGRTVVDDRVRRRLIEHAVLTVPGTAPHRGLTTRRLPAVRFADRDRNDVDVQIAAEWPLDASNLVSSVRSSIDDELARSLGSGPSDVHVHITRVSDERTEPAAAFLHHEQRPDAQDTPTRELRKHAPRRTAGASIFAVPLLLCVLALGGLALRDTVVSLGWASGGRWLDAAPRIADDVHWAWWAWPATIAALVLGAALVIAAVKPRRRSHVPVSDELWLSRRSHKARRTDGEVPR